MKRIVALIFSIIALALEVVISIKTPSVESIVAAVFSLALVVIIISIKSVRTITLTESKPKGTRPNDKVLKLANEIAPYIKEDKDIIYIKVIE